jgi:hypothetical protein
LFAESLVCFRETGSTWGVAECLIGLVRVAEAQGQLERAVRLFGAAESLRIASGVHMDPAERADDDRRLAAARSHLDDARFASMWAAGQAMSLEQAIAEALNKKTETSGIRWSPSSRHRHSCSASSFQYDRTTQPLCLSGRKQNGPHTRIPPDTAA